MKLCCLFLTALGFLACLKVSSALFLEFFINEELPVNSEFGNVKTAYFDSQGIDTGTAKFSLFQATQKYRELFAINSTSGVLRVNQRVDREQLCDKIPLCSIKFNVLHTTHEVAIKVNILDINDCTPKFPSEPVVVVEIRENNQEGYAVPIAAAHDPDLGRNGSVMYKLQNLGAPFVLRPSQEDGQLFIEASQRLDREQQDSYNMTLLASDHGSPPRTGSIQVQVRVTDVNDNSPEFVKSLFSPKLPILETAPVNSLVLTLAAADKDSGSYGQVIFDFAPELSVGGAERRQQQRLARLQFQVTPDGRVILKKPLDYDRMDKKSIVFLVIARDNSKEVNDRRTSTATVSVSISDHNDEPPSVEVCSPTGRCPGVGSVKEGQPVGARVAMVIVRDPDTNDRVSCAVNDGSGGTAASSFFELVSKTGSSEPRMEGSVNVWTYYLATKLRLDREQTPKLCFRILCSDSAGLSSTAHGHCVDISDINDNPPILLRAIQLNAMEEDSSLRPIGRLTDFLTDADEGVNAKLNFSLDAAATEPEAGATFSVDAVSGLVTPLRTLDRERRSEYLLKIRVSDNGEPARSVTVDVAIAVLDINDHAPEFESCSSIQLRLLENRPPPALVGRLTARDADWSNNGNGRVQYRLEKSAESSAFDIDRQTGEIRAVAALDRELRSHYSFRVLAEDQPQQRGLQLTGTCHVTITVDDVNDNAPSLRIDPPEFPADFVVNQLEPGHRIGHVVADDPDEGINQKVVYELLNSSDQRFSVHSDTGSILVSQPLHNIRQQLPGQSTHSIKLPLRIRACDLGQPRMCSQPVEYRAEIPAQTAADAAFRGGDSSLTNGRSPHNVNNYGNGSLLGFSNESVIICLVVTLLLLVAACFAIVCLIVRRRASAAALNSRTAAAAGAAGAACGTGTLQAGRLATEVDPDSVHAKMIDQQSPYYCPPTYKTNFNVEDDYGAYSSAQQLQHQQQMLQLNKLKHATVTRDRLYSSASLSLGGATDSELPRQSTVAVSSRRQPLSQHYQTLDSSSQQQHQPSQGQKKQTLQQQQQPMSHRYYEIEGRGGVGGNRAVLSTPQPRRQSHTLPRGGFSVDGKSAGFPLQQTQQQQLHAMQQRAPFSPYTEASFV
ncbi:hypothetical protein BOX15_Mlig024278g1 [Macrostomum lignano]|uniref:Cadherin domain-containing protein n=1 Tax=Macrostomum lignano TaxID=282301 RepID=A0A267EWL2_9PLAT|nr:hypothetical protein BOX15_Mlig024278g1 [Macrostomum lignano]